MSQRSAFTWLLLNTKTTALTSPPTSALPAGKLYWRVRKSGETWSAAWSFSVLGVRSTSTQLTRQRCQPRAVGSQSGLGSRASATSYQGQLAPDQSFLTGVRTFNPSATHQQLLHLRAVVRRAHGTSDITAAVVAGTYKTPSLAPGATYVITAKITMKSTAAAGSKVTRLVTITSVAAATKKDAVKFTGKRA